MKKFISQTTDSITLNQTKQPPPPKKTPCTNRIEKKSLLEVGSMKMRDEKLGVGYGSFLGQSVWEFLQFVGKCLKVQENDYSTFKTCKTM